MTMPHYRRSQRLRGYDYSREGAYFVTICTLGRECIFDEIINGQPSTSQLAEVVQTCWHDLPRHYRHVQLDAFVVMPNHVHGIILLTDKERAVGAGLKLARQSQKPV